ncbi:MAG TPA: hypothetical protein VD971_12750 [Phycisphaerales bacterium]|nr:hypothetical protein [Phycisphaerales bacterium]
MRVWLLIAVAGLSVGAAPAQDTPRADTLPVLDTEEGRSAFARAIGGPLTAEALAALDHVAKSGVVPAELLPVLGARTAAASDDELPPLIDALASVRTREAASMLMNIAERAPSHVDRVETALARLFALDGPGRPRGAAAWRAELDRANSITREAWDRLILSREAARARESRRLEAAVVDAQRRLHLATPAAERGDLLASMLSSPIQPSRELAFELIDRELSAGTALAPCIGDAAIALLDDPRPSTRARAAALVRQFAPEPGRRRVAETLAREDDADAAAALLLASMRWPEAGTAGVALRWARSDSPARAAAFDALWELARGAHLADSSVLAEALEAARAVPESELTPTMVWFLASVGSDEDETRVAALLTSARPGLRAAAARVLAFDGRYAASIVDAARHHPDLYETAVTAMIADQPDADAFRTVWSMGASAPETRAAQCLRLARVLPAPDLLAAAGIVDDPAVRAQILEELTAPERIMSESSDPIASAAISFGAWERSLQLLEERRPDLALAALDAAPSLGAVVGEEAAAHQRCACLVALGRLELADAAGAAPEAWVRGAVLAASWGRAEAGQTIDAVERRFGSSLSVAQRERLGAARASLKSGAFAPGTPWHKLVAAPQAVVR